MSFVENAEDKLKKLDFIKNFHISYSRAPVKFNNRQRTRVHLRLWIYEPAYVAYILTEEKTIKDIVKEMFPNESLTFDIYYQ